MHPLLPKQTQHSHLSLCGRFAVPSILLALIAASCCLWAVSDKSWLYEEQLRFNTLSQTDRNTEELNFLTQAWNREQDSFERYRLDGYDLCETCFTDFFMIASTTWQNRKREVRAGNRTWEHSGECVHAAQHSDNTAYICTHTCRNGSLWAHV